MEYVSRNISSEELLDQVSGWISILAEERYGEFFDALGYSIAGGEATSDWIKHNIEMYRDEALYPGESVMRVTSIMNAVEGYEYAKKKVEWFEHNDTSIVCAVTYHLPINGRWSNLSADFVIFDTEDGWLLKLEEIAKE